MVDWNAPDLYYLLWYRKRGSDDWLPVERFSDPSIDKFSVPNPGYYVAWEFQIQAGNDQAPGPKSPIVWSYSGQNPPAGRPENVNVVAVSARTVKLTWTRVTVARGSVDGYRVSVPQKAVSCCSRNPHSTPSWEYFVCACAPGSSNHEDENVGHVVLLKCFPRELVKMKASLSWNTCSS